MYTGTLRRDKLSNIKWLDLGVERVDRETFDLLRAAGWKHSRNPEHATEWYCNHRMVAIPDCIEYTEDEEGCTYSADRADHLRERAGKHSDIASNAYNTAHEIGSHIPMGQPILVGHHSEKRHRRDLERIDNNMRKSIEESTYAKDLAQRATSSEAHQRRIQSAGVIHRRLEKTRADLRSLERKFAQGQFEQEHYNKWKDLYEREIAEAEEALTQAGGIVADEIEINKGDIVLVHGHICEIHTQPRKNGKTYSCVIISSYGDKWPIAYERSRLKKRFYTAQEWTALPAQTRLNIIQSNWSKLDDETRIHITGK